ncbi:hypothetical protein GWG65_02990 [Bradyrhizobium sp. CSA207]|uniref:ribbon-helix-helix domain-containing protein n=1 Tax=Bradyrhizobium sp. CSA207 TaxID=2698826 RepID=UPI0023B1C7B1|nr:ribbon-helix-helix domain-containing protein [Bradyrhizobium sp. CSA207]MDE5440429.1 hypothetical protein [Bradyrhizobium sp. CSA207]
MSNTGSKNRTFKPMGRPRVLSGDAQYVTFSMEKADCDAVDEIVRQHPRYATRSEYIRAAVKAALQRDQGLPTAIIPEFSRSKLDDWLLGVFLNPSHPDHEFVGQIKLEFVASRDRPLVYETTRDLRSKGQKPTLEDIAGQLRPDLLDWMRELVTAAEAIGLADVFLTLNVRFSGLRLGNDPLTVIRNFMAKTKEASVK